MPASSSPLILGMDMGTHQPVTLEGESKDLGLYIIGAPGVGKSTLMLNMILQDIAQGQGVCVLDPHGDLINDILSRTRVDPSNIILLDPTDYNNPFGLNLFQCNNIQDPTMRSRTTSYVMGIFEKLWGDDGLHPSWGAQLEDILRHVTQTFVHAQDYTLVDVPLFLEDELFRDKVIADLSPQIQDYWYRSYNPRKDQINYRASTLNKVRKFTDDEILYPILGQSRSTIDFSDSLDTHKTILVSLPVGKIGDEAVSLLGSLIIGQLLQATLARVEQSQEERIPASLYCDEYYYFATSDFARFFAEGRKFRVSTVIAHQGRYQLDNMSKQATLNVANRAAFRISGKDAQELSREFTYAPPPPMRLILKEPLDLLLKTPHANPEVRTAIESLSSMLETFDQWDAGYPTTYRNQIQELIKDSLNNYLFEIMKKDISISSERSGAYLAKIIRGMLWNCVGLSAFNKYGRTHTYLAKADGYPRKETGIWRLIGGAEHNITVDIYSAIWDIAMIITGSREDIERVEKEWSRLIDWPLRNWIKIDIQKLRRLTAEVVRLAEILAVQPLYERSIIDPPKADPKESDVVSLLANLDKYRARVRIQSGGSIYEGTISTVEPPAPASRDSERYRQAVSYASRAAYTKPLDAVFDQIRFRQNVGRRSPQSQDDRPLSASLGIDEE